MSTAKTIDNFTVVMDFFDHTIGILFKIIYWIGWLFFGGLAWYLVSVQSIQGNDVGPYFFVVLSISGLFAFFALVGGAAQEDMEVFLIVNWVGATVLLIISVTFCFSFGKNIIVEDNSVRYVMQDGSVHFPGEHVPRGFLSAKSVKIDFEHTLSGGIQTSEVLSLSGMTVNVLHGFTLKEDLKRGPELERRLRWLASHTDDISKINGIFWKDNDNELERTQNTITKIGLPGINEGASFVPQRAWIMPIVIQSVDKPEITKD